MLVGGLDAQLPHSDDDILELGGAAKDRGVQGLGKRDSRDRSRGLAQQPGRRGEEGGQAEDGDDREH